MQPNALTPATDQDSASRVKELERGLALARGQQQATHEILRVIRSSPHDVQPVFEAIARHAVLLCDAMCGGVFSFDGTLAHFKAGYRFTEEALSHLREEYPILPRGVVGHAITSQDVVHVVDAFQDPRVANVELARKLGYRSHLVVPMLQSDRVIGTINVYGAEPRPFSDVQISLVKTFADQAVIAIENTRLFEAEQASKRGLQESLEYQRGISEVLAAISGSQFELQPVIDTIVGTAIRLCEAERGAFLRFETDGFRLIPTTGSMHGPISRAMLGKIIPFDRGSIAGRVALELTTVHVADMQADPEFTLLRGTAGDTRRSALGVPLLSGGRALGAIVLQRTEVKPFTPQQIKLVETFADQAVIAIENTRLFEAEQAGKRELQESLEYQTATSDVLSVISRSPSNLQPVLNAIVETAVRLCQADVADFRLLRDGHYHIAATTANEPTRVKVLRDNPIGPGRGSVCGRVALERRTLHVADIQADPEYTYVPGPNFPAMRAILGVPLLRDGEAIGVIVLFNSIVKPFTQKQIDLVTTFADQALIAIENTRLFEEVQARTRELTEALEQQTATSEVLAAISQSKFELQPVLDTLVASAV
jgi:GAF domain-containing protein